MQERHDHASGLPEVLRYESTVRVSPDCRIDPMEQKRREESRRLLRLLRDADERRHGPVALPGVRPMIVAMLSLSSVPSQFVSGRRVIDDE